MERMKKRLVAAGCFLAAFVLWTVMVCIVDVRHIGPMGSAVGFGSMNGFVHHLTGVHFGLYHITDWLGLVPFLVCAGFGFLGLVQWMQRKRLGKVDFDLLVLGGFYLVTVGAYLFFEQVVINYRPVLICGVLEASYPSSTTMLVMCVMPTTVMQLRRRIKNKGVRDGLSVAIAGFVAFMVVGRLVSGVHWFTDIIGGALLSAGLVSLYAALSEVRK